MEILPALPGPVLLAETEAPSDIVTDWPAVRAMLPPEPASGVDPIVRQAGVAEMARAYLGTTDPRSPLASPLFADLRGLPPLLIHVGSDEVLLDDAIGLAERAKAAGVDATLEQWDRMIHVWHWFLPLLDEAQAAVESIGSFVRARTA